MSLTVFFRFPGIADLKMADLYLIVNFFFVFASLIEFAVVSYEKAPNKEIHVKKLVKNSQSLPSSQTNPLAVEEFDIYRGKGNSTGNIPSFSNNGSSKVPFAET